MSDVIFNWVPDRGSPLPLYRQLADYISGKQSYLEVSQEY